MTCVQLYDRTAKVYAGDNVIVVADAGLWFKDSNQGFSSQIFEAENELHTWCGQSTNIDRVVVVVPENFDVYNKQAVASRLNFVRGVYSLDGLRTMFNYPIVSGEPQPREWRTWFQYETSGEGVCNGVRIQILTNRHPVHEESLAMYKVQRDICNIIDLAEARMSTKADMRNAATKEQIRKAFVDAGFAAIYMEPLPNEYHNSPVSNFTDPWYRVTTDLGHFKVGWRRHVINLDWSDTEVKDNGEVLFEALNVTKGDSHVHCGNAEALTLRLKELRASHGK